MLRSVRPPTLEPCPICGRMLPAGRPLAHACSAHTRSTSALSTTMPPYDAEDFADLWCEDSRRAAALLALLDETERIWQAHAYVHWLGKLGIFLNQDEVLATWMELAVPSLCVESLVSHHEGGRQ